MQQVITVGIASSVQPVLVIGDPNSMTPYAADAVKQAADIVKDVIPITYPLGRSFADHASAFLQSLVDGPTVPMSTRSTS